MFTPAVASLHPYSPDRRLAYLSSRESVLDIPRELEAILAALGTCCDADRQAAAVAAMLGEEPNAPRVGEVIALLVNVGLLERSSGSNQPPANGAAEHRRIDTVGIITADRAEALHACVESVAALCRRFGHALSLVVVDASTMKQSVDWNRATLEKFACDFTRVVHVGPADIADVKRKLIGAGVDATAVDFLTRSGNAGANRNLLAMLTVGHNILCLDDDIVCTPWSAQEATRDVDVSLDSIDWKERYFTCRGDALAAIRHADVSLIEAHSTLLGRPLKALEGRDRGGRPMTVAHHRLAAREVDPLVRLTFAGIVGDAGVGCATRSALHARGTERLSSSDSRLALRTREVSRVTTSYQVTTVPWCMSYCMGVSATSLLPPFLPLGRNEDGFWGATIAYADERALFGHIPVGVVHASNRPNTHPETPPSVSGVRLADALSAVSRVILQGVPKGGGTGRRLEVMGRRLVEVGDMPASDFRRFTTETCIASLASEILALDAASTVLDAAVRKDAVEAYRAAFGSQAVRPEFFVPLEVRAESTREGFRRFQQFCGDFGGLLQAWCSVWEAAPACLMSTGVLR